MIKTTVRRHADGRLTVIAEKKEADRLERVVGTPVPVAQLEAEVTRVIAEVEAKFKVKEK